MARCKWCADPISWELRAGRWVPVHPHTWADHRLECVGDPEQWEANHERRVREFVRKLPERAEPKAPAKPMFSRAPSRRSPRQRDLFR